MAGQDSYGESRDIPGQGANLLSSLLFRAPFGSGNIRTALVATLTFLNANGYSIRVSDAEAADIVKAASQRKITQAQAIAQLCVPSENGAPTASLGTLRQLIAPDCNTHKEARQMLASGD